MKQSSQARVPIIDQDAFTIFDVPNQTGTPERNLLVAILERAILDFVGNDSEAVQDAEDWLFGDPDCREEFSFNWVCHQLDLNIVEITQKIRCMPKRGSRRIAPWYFKSATAEAVAQ